MLERMVLIDGIVYDRHELVMVAMQPSSDPIVTVRSSHSEDDETATETSYEVALAPTVDFATWEQTVWALPEFEEWTDTAAGLSEVLGILTDEQAERMSALFPKWKVGTGYAIGDRVQFDSKLYRCVQAHTPQEGWEPVATPALWVRTAAEGNIPEWVQPTGAQDAYIVGDRVRHHGATWESEFDANVWEPGVYGWEEVAS